MIYAFAIVFPVVFTITGMLILIYAIRTRMRIQNDIDFVTLELSTWDRTLATSKGIGDVLEEDGGDEDETRIQEELPAQTNAEDAESNVPNDRA